MNAEKINKLTFVGVQYKKNTNQIIRMINSFIAIEKFANWIIFYDQVDFEKIKEIIKDMNLDENKFVCTNGIRIERIKQNLNEIETEYLMIIDGDDFVEFNSARTLANELNSIESFDLIYLNNESFVVHGDKIEADIIDYFHPSLNFVSNVIYSKKLLQNDELFLLKKQNKKISNDDYENFKKLFIISDQLTTLNFLQQTDKVYFLNIKSPYVRELESSTSMWKSPSTNYNFGQFWKIKHICNVCEIRFDFEYCNYSSRKEKAIILSSLCTFHEKYLINVDWNSIYSELKDNLYLIRSPKRLIFAYLFYSEDMNMYNGIFNKLLLNIELLHNLIYEDEKLNFKFSDEEFNFSIDIDIEETYIDLLELIKYKKHSEIDSFIKKIKDKFK